MSAPGPPPVQASDPARLTNGQVVQRPVVDMPTGGSFTVDLERAPQTLQDLTAARDELLSLMQDARALGNVHPGSSDEVSRDAATMLGVVAVGGQGSLVEALEAGVARLGQLIDGVNSELRAYRAAESANGASFDETRS
jgi:hypothetical protein